MAVRVGVKGDLDRFFRSCLETQNREQSNRQKSGMLIGLRVLGDGLMIAATNQIPAFQRLLIPSLVFVVSTRDSGSRHEVHSKKVCVMIQMDETRCLRIRDRRLEHAR